jgi:hypothetical protein
LISTGGSTESVPDPGRPGGTWEDVGTIDSSREGDLWKVVQTYLGFRSTPRPRTLDFYLDGDPRSPWVQTNQQPRLSDTERGFWMAIDVYSDARQYLVSTRQAHVCHLKRRPPEPHPGLLVVPVLIGIRLRASDHGMFRQVEVGQ